MAEFATSEMAPSGVSRVEWAYREIKRRILDNTYPPGHQALEQELAAELGVSRTPVRECLIRLQHEGLIELVPRRGMRVLPISPQDLQEIYHTMTFLEELAAELLARNEPDDQTLAPLSDAVVAMEQALEADDIAAWAAADRQFHEQLIELSGSQRLVSIVGNLRDQAERARLVFLQLSPPPEDSTREHRALLEAIAAGDWEEAKAIHDRHRRRNGRIMAETLAKYRLPQF